MTPPWRYGMGIVTGEVVRDAGVGLAATNLLNDIATAVDRPVGDSDYIIVAIPPTEQRDAIDRVRAAFEA